MTATKRSAASDEIVLSSGKRIPRLGSNRVTNSSRTSSAVIQAPPDLMGHKSKFTAMLAGFVVPNVIQEAPPSGKVERLWSVYVQGANSFAQKGCTGADVAILLCVKGYVDIWYQGKCFKAGSPEEKLPDGELLRQAATYVVAKGQTMPTRQEFFRLTKPIRALLVAADQAEEQEILDEQDDTDQQYDDGTDNVPE